MAHEHVNIRGPLDSVNTVATMGTIATVQTTSETAPQAHHNLGRNSEAIGNMNQEQIRGAYTETDVGKANTESSPIDADVAQAMNKTAIRNQAAADAERSQFIAGPGISKTFIVGFVVLLVIVVAIVGIVVAVSGNDEEDDPIVIEDEDRLGELCDFVNDVPFVVCVANEGTRFLLCDPSRNNNNLVDGECLNGNPCACPEGVVNAISIDENLDDQPFCLADFECEEVIDGFEVIPDEDISDDSENESDQTAEQLIRDCQIEGRVCIGDDSFVQCLNDEPTEEFCNEPGNEECRCGEGIILKNFDFDICSATTFC